MPVGAYLALQIPVLQTYAAKKAAGSLSGSLGAEVSIGKVYYIFFDQLIAKDISIVSNGKDTLLSAQKISLRIDPRQFISGKKLRFGHIRLEKGEFNIIHESDSTTNLDRIFGSGKISDKDSTEKPLPDIEAFQVKLSGFRFRMVNPFSAGYNDKNGSVNFSNLDASNINIEIRDLKVWGDSLSANIKSLTLEEKSGFNIKNLATFGSFANGGIYLRDFSFDDGYSAIDALKLNLLFDSFKAFSHFTDLVHFDVVLSRSKLSFVTLSAFAPSLKDNKLLINIDGAFEGPVSAIKTNNLKVSSESGLSYLELDARITGLPDIDETTAFLDIRNSTTTTNDIAFIISTINGSKPINALKNLSPLVRYSFEGRIAGLFEDFVTSGTLTSNIGTIHIDALIKGNQSGKGGMELSGNLEAQEFDLGKLIQNNSLGKFSLTTNLSAKFGKEVGGTSLSIDSLSIDKFEFNDYTYQNIYAAGKYERETFDGKIICRDPNLNLLFQGIISTSPVSKANSYYDFYADVIYADIAALNFDKRDTLSAVSMKSMANFTRNTKGDIEGTINVRDLNFENSKGDFHIGDISIQSSSLRDNYTLFLRSAFANATYRGGSFITGFFQKVMELTLYSNLGALFDNGERELVEDNGNFSLEVDFLDTRAISEMILPGLFIGNGSTLRAGIDKGEAFNLKIESDGLRFGSIFADNLRLLLNSSSKGIESSISSDRLHFSGLNLDSNRVNVSAHNNQVRVKSEYSNKGSLENRLDFLSDIQFTKIDGSKSLITDITIYPSEIYLNGENWKFSGSKVVNQDSTFVFHDLYLYSGEQYLGLDGIISNNPYDTLSVVLNNLQISPLNYILGLDELGIRGSLSGFASVSNLFNSPEITADFVGKEMEINKKDFGELLVASRWNNQAKIFEIDLENQFENRKALITKGFFRPKDSFLSLDLDLDNLHANYFEPFLEGIVSSVNGGVTGSVKLEGPGDKLLLTGSGVTLNDLSFLVDFTNVRYALNGPVILTENGINLNNVAIKDRFGNTGRISGGLNYRYFKDISMNTSIMFSGLEALNTTEEDNSSFYGTAFTTGRLAITGPLERIMMDITVTTNRNTSIHIPLSSATDVSGSNLLTFVQPSSKYYDQNGNPVTIMKSPSGSELIVKLRANMTPDAAMLIEIDKSVGDIITGYGSGLVTLDINPSKDLFSIQGDYRIQRGSYKFVLQGFIERDFTIQEGGNIGFNGDIMKTNLNLTANYRTKAAINTLIADTSAVASRRTVDCQINMTGQLMNPRLGFNIEIPDIDPITKARVNAALNSDDKVVRQVMSLLVSGSFIPDVQSSIVNNSTILYSNATEVLSNQINKIFNQLDIPLDLSFNYQPGQNGRDMFDAAVSAQLFNNRVVVNGNIGSARYLDRSGDVVGDLDVEIKLDDKGRFRAKAFSHSADQYSNYLDNSQRNGLGLVYQEEFSSFRELLNSLFTSRRKRERRTQKEKAMIKPREDEILNEATIVSPL